MSDSLWLMMQHNERESWNLNNRNDPRDHDHQVGRFPVVPKTARDDAEGSVAEDSEGGNLHTTMRPCSCPVLSLIIELPSVVLSSVENPPRRGILAVLSCKV